MDNVIANDIKVTRWKDEPVPKLSLVMYPAKSLLQPCEPVVFNEDFRLWIIDFIEVNRYLREAFGGPMVGIAASQVGKNIRCFIAYDKIYINPEIIWTTKAPPSTEREGCLSLPMDKSWSVTRPPSITLKYQNLDQEWKEDRFNGIQARVIQHELDHLEGKLCCGEDYPNK